MENTVTLTLEKYHDLLDKSEESIDITEYPVVCRKIYLKGNIHSMECDSEELIYLNETDSIKSITDFLKDKENELSQIKNHWAYKLFIKK